MDNQEEIKKLVKMGKAQLLEFCKSLGIKADEKNTAKDMAAWISEAVEDLNTWLEAKNNVPKSMKKAAESAKKPGEEAKGLHKGKYLGKVNGQKQYAE